MVWDGMSTVLSIGAVVAGLTIMLVLLLVIVLFKEMLASHFRMILDL